MPLIFSETPESSSNSPCRRSQFNRALSIPVLLLIATATWFSLGDYKAKLPLPAAGSHNSGVVQGDDFDTRAGGHAGNLVDLGKQAIPVGGQEMEAIPPREWMSSAWQSGTDPVLSAFSGWAMEYIRTDSDGRKEMENQGINLASSRRVKMLALITGDPRMALANAVPAEVSDQLPASVSALLELTVHGFGDLVTEYRCDEQNSSSKTVVQVGGATYDASLYGSRRNLNYYLGSSIHGVALEGQMAVLDSPLHVVKSAEAGKTGVRFLVGDEEHSLPAGTSLDMVDRTLASIDGSDTKLSQALASKGLDATYGDYIYAMGDSGLSASIGYPQRRATSHTHGGKRILILRLRASDDTFPSAQTEAVFQNWAYSADGWDQRLRLTTYNKTWLSGVDVTPVLVMPNPASYYVYNNSTGTVYESGRWATDGEAAARAAGYNPDDYFCVVVGTRVFANGGIGWAAGKRIWVNGAYDNFAALMHHEFGHILGLPHASAWSSSDGNPMSAGRVNEEYGDENDPMGNGGKTFRNTYQAYFKNLSGWMPDTSVQTVVEDGIYTVYQDDGATDFNRPLALKLGRDHEIMYWLSVRGDLIQTNNIVNQNNFLNGVSIVAVSPWTNPHTLDLNNPSSNRANSPLALNQTWYDSNADITFKTVEIGGMNPNHYAKVQITFGPLYRGGYRPLVSGGVYRFKNRQNNRYLTIPGNSMNNGVRVAMADLNTTNNSQLWVAWRNGDGSYSFNRQGTTKWLDVSSNSGTNGAAIWQYDFSTTGDDAQRWNIFQTETDSVFMLHKGTEGRLMEMDVNSQVVHQMNTTGTNWQQWYPELAAISPGTYRILPRVGESQALGIGNAAVGNGPESMRGKWQGYSNQQWTVSNLDNGRVRLTPAHAPTKALDVYNSATADGSRINQWVWNESAAQRWQYSRVDGTWLRFTPDSAPGGSLDARGAATGSVVQLGTYSGAQSQQWRFADADPSITETPFQLWGRRLQLSGNKALAGVDLDGDGVINLMEFALDGSPSSPTSRGSYLPVSSEAGNVLVSAVRAGAVFVTTGTGSLFAVVDGIRYEVQASLDLSDWSLPVEALTILPPHEGPSLTEGWEYRAFRAVEPAYPSGAFIRVKVSDVP